MSLRSHLEPNRRIKNPADTNFEVHPKDKKQETPNHKQMKNILYPTKLMRLFTVLAAARRRTVQ